jgi:hypothetical protein
MDDATPKLDTSHVIIQNPQCGQPNGSITNIFLSTNQDIQIKWINESGVVVSDQMNLTNVAADKYKLALRGARPVL